MEKNNIITEKKLPYFIFSFRYSEINNNKFDNIEEKFIEVFSEK